MRRYVITGGASGIGAATTALLRSAGYEACVVDLRDADVVADLGKPDARAAVAARFPALDAVVAAAGTNVRTADIVSVNYFGVVELLEALRPALAEASHPRAVAVASLASVFDIHNGLVEACLAGDEAAARGVASSLIAEGREHILYASTKAALCRWIRRTAVTAAWAGAGIPLNAVCPGTVLTPMTASLVADEGSRRELDAIVPMPLGGHAPPDAIAHALMWLASPANTHATGQCLFVDGGADAVLRGEAVW